MPPGEGKVGPLSTKKAIAFEASPQTPLEGLQRPPTPPSCLLATHKRCAHVLRSTLKRAIVRLRLTLAGTLLRPPRFFEFATALCVWFTT